MTGTFEGVKLETYISGANLNGEVYSLLQLDASANVVLATAATQRPVGFLAHDPKRAQFDTTDTTGDAVSVGKISGKIPLRCNGTVPVGAYVQAAAGGGVVSIGTDPTAATAGTFVIGQAMEAGVTDQVITVDADQFFTAA